MIRRFLTILVLALPILLVSFAVLMGGYAITTASGDQLASRVLWWISMGCLMLVVVDALLLVGTLGIASLSDESESSDDQPPS